MKIDPTSIEIVPHATKIEQIVIDSSLTSPKLPLMLQTPLNLLPW